jgi:HEAT repeat protein
LGRLDQNASLGPLLRALGDTDPWVRFFAVRSLGELNTPAVAPAVRRLVGSDPAVQVRLAAIEVLGRLNDQEAIQILEPLSVSREVDVARTAIRALGRSTDERAASLLEGLLRAPDSWRREEAATALGACGGPRAASILQWTAAAETEPGVARAAIAGLALMASGESPQAIDAIDALVSLTAERAQREASITALAGLGSCRIADVAKGLRHLSAEVRQATVAALSRMKHPEATRWLETALADPAAAVRATAVAELRRLGTRHAAKTLLTLARTDPDHSVRQAALLAVAQRDALSHGDAPERD